jgi:5'-nucleotidase
VNFPDCNASAAGPLTLTRQGIGLVEGIEIVPEVDLRGFDYFWLRLQGNRVRMRPIAKRPS